MAGSWALVMGPPTTVFRPRCFARWMARFIEGPCTIMPLKNTTSAQSKSESFNGRTFMSTTRFCHCRGKSAETVNRPSGGYAERFPWKGRLCLKLQKVSGNSG